jgi:hypothetical protein
MKHSCLLFLIVLCSSYVAAEEHVFYYHGQIVETQGANAKSPLFGSYEYTNILRALKAKGFTVHAKLRNKGTDVETFAKAEAVELQQFFSEIAPANEVTLIGASKGARIVIAIQNILRERELKSVLLAGIFRSDIKNTERKLFGEVLSIYDKSDTWLAEAAPLIERSKELVNFKEVVIDKNLKHGLLFKPYDDWLLPATAFAKE